VAVFDNSSGPGRKTTGARTGGRSERVVASVLEAAITELAEVGYTAFRLDDVATRAGVAKTTIYRRWPTKIELIGDALRKVTAWHEPLPDTGSIRTDILTLLDRGICLMATGEGLALARVMTTEPGDPDFLRLAKQMRDESRAYRGRLVTRAIERGELPKGTDAGIMMDSIFAPIMSRIVKWNETVDKKTRERIVDLIVTGAEHGGGKKR
jgi:AcrR family transcriptional regulator